MRRILTVSALTALMFSFSFLAQGQPVIGISSSHKDNGSVSCGDSYINAVAKAGGIPVVLPLVTSPEMAAQVISAVDGVLFTGGEDFNPAWYGEEIINSTVSVNAVRDTSDIALVRAAKAAGKPILGICRGHQAVCVALGGSLYQDIPAQVPDCLKHKQSEPSSQTTQTIGLLPGCRLSKIMGGVSSVEANSHHHEAVKVPAPGMRICGAATDGVVEVCESTDSSYVLTVQFHPEKLIASGDYTFMPIFVDFVSACRK